MEGHSPPHEGRGLFERGLALALVAALLATAFSILAPFGTILLWSLFMSVTIWPLHRWILLRTGGHPPLAATLSVAVLLVVVVAPVVLATAALLPSIRNLVTLISRPETWTLPAPPEWMRQVPFLGRLLQGTWQEIVDALLAQLALDGERLAHDVGVEGAGQATVAGHRDHGDRTDLGALLHEGELLGLLGVRGEVHHHLDHVGGVRPQRLDARLVAAQLGRRDHLHGLGDLARALDRRDAPADVAQTRHVRPPPPPSRPPPRSRPPGA